MRITVKLKPVDTILKNRGIDSGGAVQRYIDSEVLRLCQPYVPLDQGMLIASGRLATTLGSGEVRYNTPYAHKWYYQPAHFNGAPTRGNYWFERMKDQGGKTEILRGVKRLTGVK